MTRNHSPDHWSGRATRSFEGILHSLMALAACGVMTANSALAESTDEAPPRNDWIALSEEDLNEGWIQLFDNRTLFGWKKQTDANWRVADGAIHVDSGAACLLTTTSRWAEFELRLEFSASPEANGGVFLFTDGAPRRDRRDCLEIAIADARHVYSTGAIVGREKSKAQPPGDGWHAMTIRAKGNAVVVAVDGQPTAKLTDPDRPRLGRIALQFNRGALGYRNIQLRPLNLKPLFAGESLEAWKQYPEMASRFSVTDEGALQALGGPGLLETRDEFADFVLQLVFKTNGERLNSGVFFRCIPGEKMNGYESQIHSGFEHGDRTRPTEGQAGTGAIFRRTQARAVLSDDHRWCRKTIVVDGPHIVVWVEGILVTDWTDTRAPDKNPRRGLRTRAGTIQLQGHDPTTDVLFRDIEIAELPRRPLADRSQDGE